MLAAIMTAKLGKPTVAAKRTVFRTFTAIAVALPLLATQSHGQAASPFKDLSGAWRGSGSVTLANGTEETIRCRANYDVGSEGNVLRQSLRCASASYKFELSSEVSHESGTISGTWTEATHKIGGSVSGSVLNNGYIHAVVDAPGFSASLSVTTRGNRQSVQITSKGQELTKVSIALRRS